MPSNLTPDQLSRLQNLDISCTGGIPFPPSSPISKPTLNTSDPILNISKDNKLPPKSSPTTAKIIDQTTSSSQANRLLTTKISPQASKNTIIPLLSISGLTLLSFGGLILFKNKSTNSALQNPPPANQPPAEGIPTPAGLRGTQVPKSIQHYLLASQQYFSQALQLQNDPARARLDAPFPSDQEIVSILNQSILTASDAIKQFPQDYRGYQQRAKIYQSLSDSQPQLLTQAIADYTAAYKLNSNSAEITRDLASLYAKAGDANNTIAYLAQTVALEPTKAQNFYDLAKLQQQVGLLPQALETYNSLLPLITDSTQRQQIETEKLALENLTHQCKGGSVCPPSSIPTPKSLALPSPSLDSPTIQASTSDGPIIAAAPTSQNITVNNQTESNSLSGTSILPANQVQINIPNTNLTTTSQIYLTITKGGKNQTLQVISKTSGLFTVGLDSPISEPIEFKWWIIN